MTEIPEGTKCEECENDAPATQIWSPGGEATPICANCWDIYGDSDRTYIEADGTEVIDHRYVKNAGIISRTMDINLPDAMHRPYIIVKIKTEKRKRQPFTWIDIEGDYESAHEAQKALTTVAAAQSTEIAQLGVRHKLAIKPEDKAYWKDRKKRLAKLHKNPEPEYLIERFDLEGAMQSTCIAKVGESWHRTDVDLEHTTTVRNIGSFDSVTFALASQADAVTVGQEMTLISTNGALSEVFALLKPENPEIQPPNPDLWETFPCYIEWEWFDEEVFEEHVNNITPEALSWQLSPTQVNGNIVLRINGPSIRGYMPLDEMYENQQPLITTTILTDWWMTGGGGAPVSWDGSTTLGLSGASVLATCVSGDLDPGCTIQALDENTNLVEVVADYLVNTWKSAEAFLLNAIGLTDLPNGPYFDWRDSRGGDTENCHEVLVNLPHDQIQQIIDIVENHSPRLKEVADTLRDSTTIKGKKIYGLLPQIIEGEESIYAILEVLWGDAS